MMDEALIEAFKAYREDEVPIGAVIVGPERTILSRAHNQKEKANNPCGHAEILAITEAAKKINNWRLIDCSIYVTLEPCPMCLSALVQSRIGNLFFGAYDAKGGALSLNYNFYKDRKLNHTFPVLGGLRHFECSKILSTFFREKRQSYNKF
ncbi:MAG: nucleoside deaminase [Bacteriovoracaceae bacterium]|nr:nucleoside deaminase [Bacteriovoracaceae bacterium]